MRKIFVQFQFKDFCLKQVDRIAITRGSKVLQQKKTGQVNATAQRTTEKECLPKALVSLMNSDSAAADHALAIFLF